MKNKHCEWCDHQFQTNISYQIYCSAECRDASTKEKIAARYVITRRANRYKKPRKCRSCDAQLSMYNDDTLCQKCTIDPTEVNKVLREMKKLRDKNDRSD
jgi:hypothetical protein